MGGGAVDGAQNVRPAVPRRRDRGGLARRGAPHFMSSSVPAARRSTAQVGTFDSMPPPAIIVMITGPALAGILMTGLVGIPEEVGCRGG
jgi:hypothetical protein